MNRKVSLKNLTILDILEVIFRQHGNRTALQIKNDDGDFRKISYFELGKRSLDLSSTLIRIGIHKNDCVAILSENRPEWVISFFSIILSGSILVPLDSKLSQKEIQFILNNSQTKCIFVSKKYIDKIDMLFFVLPYLERVILFDESNRDDVILFSNCKYEKEEKKVREIASEETALIVYTSGTTGVAKGVELTYGNLLFQVYAINEIIHYNEKDEFLSILPLNHMLEITGGMIAPLYAGSCITFAHSLKTPVLLSLMKETHTTTMLCVPLVLKMFYDQIERKINELSVFKRKMIIMFRMLVAWFLKCNIPLGGLLFPTLHKEFGGHIRGFISGGAPLSKDVELGLKSFGFSILQGYGLTETSPVVSVNTFTSHKVGSVGKPLPGVEVRIAKQDKGKDEGEIQVKGPNVMKGYYNNPAATMDVLKYGWFSTGDLGYFDKNGFLFISGRIKNLIVLSAGKKVFPEEIEDVMSNSPHIQEICVIPKIQTEGKREGCEQVYAIIIPTITRRDDDEVKIKQVIKDELNRLGTQLADYKKISAFELWYDELPRTATKKIKRQEVIKRMMRKEDN